MSTSEIQETSTLHSKDSSTSLENVTFGLPKALGSLAQWAAQHGLEEPLFLILEATKCIEHSVYIGTVLAYLRQAVPMTCLQQWDMESPFLGNLYSLGQAAAVSPFICQQFPPMPTVQAMSRQFQGGLLTELLLIALIARPVQCATHENQIWIETLRVWCFIQLLDVTYSGRTSNRYLITVANKLRQAVDGDKDWLEFFERLRGPTASLHAVQRHLHSRCEMLLADKHHPVTRPIERTALSELLAYCEGRHPSTGGSEVIPSGLFAKFKARTQDTRPSTEELRNSSVITLDTLDEPLPPKIIEICHSGAASDEFPSLTEVLADAADSPPTQLRKAKGVILATIEDNQFLPFSWNRPNEFEQTSLINWIQDCWAQPNHLDHDLALLAWIALQTSHSLRTALGMELSSTPSSDWCLDPARGVLHRQPPRRYNSWSADDTSKKWVTPCVGSVEIKLPMLALRFIKELQEKTPDNPKTLAGWFTSQPSAESRFRKICQATPELSRLTSGMLARGLAQQVYSLTTDSTLSLLLSSHPRTGLPGACAYSAYSHVVIAQALRQAGADMGGDEPHMARLNAAGSELDPIESLLRIACATALKKVNQLACDPKRWLEHHNALTGHCVLALLAATGARPVTSPFESLANFDLQAKMCFIDDKSVSAQHEGRLLPLPDAVITLIQDRYLPHLQRIANIIKPIDAMMSDVIYQTSVGAEGSKLPLFFFLTSNPELGWVEVSEKTLSSLDLFNWPLPWNLMRHRLASSLRRMGMDHEITNGLCGHGEQGTAAYGPYSVRTLFQDLEACRATLVTLYNQLDLGLPEPAAWPETSAAPVTKPSAPLILTGSNFGAQARRDRRQDQHTRARTQALEDIRQKLNNRPIDSLPAEEWEALGQSMLLTSTGMPHPLASLRYETFSDWLQEQWKNQGVLPQLRKRYLPALEEPSPFSARAIGAQFILERSRETLRDLGNWPPSKTTVREYRLLGCISLLLECRIGDGAVIRDAAAGVNHRLVHFQGQHYLEHAVHLSRWPDAPVRRFWISTQTAAWLTLSRSDQNIDLYKYTPGERFKPLLDMAELSGEKVSCGPLLHRLTSIVQQCNAIEFPSLVAAYLNGKIVTAALGHADWIRVHMGMAPVLTDLPVIPPKKSADQKDEDGLEVLSSETAFDDPSDVDRYAINAAQFIDPTNPHVSTDTSPPALLLSDADKKLASAERLSAQLLARKFFQTVRQKIREHSAESSSPRRNLDVALRECIADAKDVSVSCRLLAEWTRSLLWRRGRSGRLRLSSIERYLNALSPCYEAEAYDHDLIGCDGEELTDFYGRILEARRLISPHRGSENAEALDTATDSSKESYRTWALASHLLKDFHRTLSHALSLEDPDWSEFMGDETPLSISPGLLLEQDYLHCLHLLTGDAMSAPHMDLALGFILLMCMRFGLRGHEVDGLMREDLVETEDGSIVVLVRSNRLRSLKTLAGRRQIPLVFELTPLEKAIYQRFLALWSGISAGDQSVPLFADTANPRKRLNGRALRQRISTVIKQATKNPHLSLHHARHTFANRVAQLLLDKADALWPFLAGATNLEERSLHVRKLLLCTTKTTRRSLWALARLLGHAHPQTTVRSYLHLLPDLTAKLIQERAKLNAENRVTADAGVIDLEALPHHLDYLQLTAVPSEPRKSSITVQTVLRFLRRCQTSDSATNAAFETDLPLLEAETVLKSLEIIDTRLATRHHINSHFEGRSRLLSHITPSCWERWDNFASQQGNSMTWTQDDWASINQRLDQLGASRQWLLFENSHFIRFKQFIHRWGLTAADVQLVCSNNLHQAVASWAADTGFPSVPLKTLIDQGNKIQLDTATTGYPPNPVKHRCAVLAHTDAGSMFKSSFEFVLLYLIDCLFS